MGKDFAYRLAEEIPAVTLEETEQLLRGAREEAFGEPGKQKRKLSGSLEKLPEGKSSFIIQDEKTSKTALLYTGFFPMVFTLILFPVICGKNPVTLLKAFVNLLGLSYPTERAMEEMLSWEQRSMAAACWIRYSFMYEAMGSP